MGERRKRAGQGDPESELRHEIRGLLGQIVGYAELVDEECEDRGLEDLRPDLAHIVGAARELMSLSDRGLAPGARAAAAAGQLGGASTATHLELLLRAPASPEDHGAILIIDDDPAIRSLLLRNLGARGFTPSDAASGEEGLALLEEAEEAGEPFELLLLDLGMPGLSGHELLARIRDRRGPAELPVIVLTGEARSEAMVRSFSLGANDYVSKPFEMPEVLARIRAQLSVRRSSARARGLLEQLALRNRFIKRVLGRYVNDELAEELSRSPEGPALGGQTRVVTIMFTDLRGFTLTTEGLPPEEVVRMLNGYLSVMSEVLESYRATQVDFRGDAIVAAFGALVHAENDARDAIECAARMQAKMAEVNRLNAESGLPPIAMGIGLHTGEVVVGNVGSERFLKFTLIGKHANLAARVESFAGAGEVLLTGATLEAAGPGVRVGAPREEQLKGIREPVALYPLLSIDTEGGR